MWLNSGGGGKGAYNQMYFCFYREMGWPITGGTGLIRGSLWCTYTCIVFAPFVISFLFFLSNVRKRKAE